MRFSTCPVLSFLFSFTYCISLARSLHMSFNSPVFRDITEEEARELRKRIDSEEAIRRREECARRWQLKMEAEHAEIRRICAEK